MQDAKAGPEGAKRNVTSVALLKMLTEDAVLTLKERMAPERNGRCQSTGCDARLNTEAAEGALPEAGTGEASRRLSIWAGLRKRRRISAGLKVTRIGCSQVQEGFKESRRDVQRRSERWAVSVAAGHWGWAWGVLEATLGSLNLTLTIGSHGESQRRGPPSHVLASSDSRPLTNPHPTSTFPVRPFSPSRHKRRVGRGQGQAFPLSSPWESAGRQGLGFKHLGLSQLWSHCPTVWHQAHPLWSEFRLLESRVPSKLTLRFVPLCVLHPDGPFGDRDGSGLQFGLSSFPSGKGGQGEKTRTVPPITPHTPVSQEASICISMVSFTS